MAHPHDPHGFAALWRQAATKVGTLRRDVGGEDAVLWNEAIDRAAGILEQEAVDVRAMGRMAYLLIVGNVAPVENPST